MNVFTGHCCACSQVCFHTKEANAFCALHSNEYAHAKQRAIEDRSQVLIFGWQCLICKSVYAPHVSECEKHGLSVGERFVSVGDDAYTRQLRLV